MPNLGLLTQAGASASPPQSPDLFPFQRLIRRFTPMERVRELYRRAQQSGNRPILENLLSEMRVECRVSDSDLARVPVSGAAVVTANHPFGLLDGAVLGTLLNRVRPDVKVLTNVMLAEVPELHEYCIFVDPFGGEDAVGANRRGVRQAVEWLRSGGMLAMFPAGEVSHFRLQDMGIADPQWNTMAARLVRMTKATAIPVFLPGCNSATFQALGLLHPRLRTAWLINEFLQQTDRVVEVRIGSRISHETICAVGSDRQAADYLRGRTYILSIRGEVQRRIPAVFHSVFPRKPDQALVAPIPVDQLQRNLGRLNPSQLLFENNEFRVYEAKAREIPDILREIGRLREATFREVGEGTGKSIDLDRFDHYYTHIFLWGKANSEIVGAYRIGVTSEILPHMGVEGLYTNTLFRYDSQWFDKTGPALELGRSFIRPQYQRQYAPLLTLWRGIGRYLVAHPEYPVLFGAVSISNRYCRWSRELVVRFFGERDANEELGRLITPRRPFRPRKLVHKNHPAQCATPRDFEHLSDLVTDLELDGRGVPILFKHYAKLGGRLLGFNVDKDFSDVLDGLVLVDLRRSNPTVLQRYLGEDGLRAFQSYHGLRMSGDPA